MKPALVLLLPLLVATLPAWGQAYKCRQPDGSTQISSEPCAGGARTLKEVDEDVVSPEARARAARDAERARERADRLESERRADEAAERKERERQRKESGLPSEAAIQQCLNTLGRMNLDSSRRSEMEKGRRRSRSTSTRFRARRAAARADPAYAVSWSLPSWRWLPSASSASLPSASKNA